MKLRILLALILTGLALSVGRTDAQTPAPVVVQAAPAAGVTTAATSAPAGPPSANSILDALQQMKAANDEILRKQAATLQQLDEIEKAAEQLKIYSKRG